MAKAVTLKNNNNEEIYPVTDISLVNGELNGARIVNASVGSDKLTPNAVWEENIKDGAVTSSKIDWTKLQKYYKACSRVDSFNLPSKWQQITPSGWTLTFSTNAGEIYKAEIVTGYLCWYGSTQAELDMHLLYSGATVISTARSTMTGTYGGGVSIGRRVSGILKATGNSMTVEVGVTSDQTGNYARIDPGYILVERIA